MSNDLNSLPTGLRERILKASTATEVQSLLASAEKFVFMSAKTRRAVANAAKRRINEIGSKPEPVRPAPKPVSKAFVPAPKAPPAPQAEPETPKVTSRDRRKAARAHLQPAS